MWHIVAEQSIRNLLLVAFALLNCHVIVAKKLEILGFFQVRKEDKREFMSYFLRSVFLIFVMVCGVSTPSLALDYYRVIDEPINVRTGPGTNNKMIAQVYKGENVLFIKQQGDWANIFFLHPDGRKVEGWIHSKFIKKEADAVQSNSPVVAEAIGANLDCATNKNRKGISGCLLDIDLTVTGPFGKDSVSVRCESEMLMELSNGQVKPVQETGRIRTPLKSGAGAARMQLMVFPLIKGDYFIENLSVVDYRCIAE